MVKTHYRSHKNIHSLMFAFTQTIESFVVIACSTNLFDFIWVGSPTRTERRLKICTMVFILPENRLYTCSVTRTILAAYISMWCKMSSTERSNTFAVLMLLLSSVSKYRAAVSIRTLLMWWTKPKQAGKWNKFTQYQRKLEQKVALKESIGPEWLVFK